MSVYQLFGLGRYVTTLLQGQYLYLLGGLFLAQVFLCFRMFKAAPAIPQWYDWALSALALAGMGYFAATAEQSLDSGWEYAAPDTARWVSLLVYLLILEGTRRAGGFTLFIIVAVFSVYPTFADKVPNPLNGFAQPFWDTVPYHIISAESSFGIPMRAFGTLVIGFILFGAVLQRTGGGKFFNDLALALVGRFRGGAAKVAIFRLRLHGLHVRLGDLQRLDHRCCVDPRHEEVRLPAALCGGHGSVCVHRRGADAADHGGDGVRHGLVPGAALHRDRAGRRHSLDPVLFRPVRADRRLCGQARAEGHCAGRTAVGAGGGEGRLAVPVRVRPFDLHDGAPAPGHAGAVLRHGAVAGDQPVS